MRVAIPDDYQDCVRSLACFSRLRRHEVTVFNDTVHDETSLAERLADFDAVVLTRERTRMSASLLARLPRLRLLSQTGKVAGHIDIDACTRLGITVEEGEGTGAATAELAWALILASRRNLVEEALRLRRGQWQCSLGQQLRGQRLGIWSCGRIGRQLASYGHAFGMDVWVWGGEGSLAQASADGVETAPSRASFFAASDVLTLHLRLGERTRGMITGEDLKRMRPTSLIVNTSRAELIAPGALALALREGRPGYAAVDVFEHEPVNSAQEPLLQLPSVLCTPHLGYVERDNCERYLGIAFDNINRFAPGDYAAVINPKALQVLHPARSGADF
jgi:D-3-phosphoglycerate dehydrogenase